MSSASPERRLVPPVERERPAPTVLYHVSPSANDDTIARDGLQVANPAYGRWAVEAADQPPGVYCFADVDDAHEWAELVSGLVSTIWEIDAAGLRLEHDWMMHRECFYSPQPIEAARLYRLGTHVPAHLAQ